VIQLRSRSFNKARCGGRALAALVWWCILVAFVAGTAALLVLAPITASAAEPQAEIVARVNGEALTRPEFERMRANPLTLRELQQSVQNPDSKELDRLALRKLIQLRLVVQEARARKITIKEKELDEAIAKLRRGFKDLKGFGEWMNEQGLSEKSLFDSIRSDMAADRVRAALVKNVSVSDEQVQQYYEAHKEQLKSPEVRLQVIVVKDRAAADEALKALREIRDFASVARQRSLGRLAANGGDTGWVALETLSPTLRNFVGTMKVGQTGGPLQKSDEFLIVRLAERRSGKMKDLAEVRPQIEPYLLAIKRQEVVRDWLAEKEKKAKVEVLLF
jgi:parvulin-like peptidyl-prolyl isomerase